MTRKPLLRLLASAAMLAAICACGGGDPDDTSRGLDLDPTTEPSPPPAAPQIAQTPPPIGVDLRSDQEPPLQLRIEHAGGVAHGPIGAPIALGEGDDAPTITVHPGPTRTFPHGNLRFSYPSSFVFEAEIEPDLSEWTLSGNHFEIMIFRYPDASPADATIAMYVQGIRAQFGAGVRESQTTIQLGERTLNGTRLHLSIATQTLTQDAFAFSHRGSTYLLVLQDGQPERQYPEATEARRLLATTFTLQ